MFQKLVPFCTAHRNDIIRLFQIGYLIGFLFLVFCAWVIFSGNQFVGAVFEAGTLLGQGAIILFVIVTTPGILGRFGVKHPLITIGIMFRRHTGISMFLAGMAHALIVSLLPKMAMGLPILPLLVFETFGLLTLLVLFPLFLTSNLYSQQHLGKNWKRIHKTIYIAFWLMMLHTGLQGEMKFSILIGVMGVLETVSLIYDWKKQKVVPPPVTSPSPTPTVPPTPITAPIIPKEGL